MTLLTEKQFWRKHYMLLPPVFAGDAPSTAPASSPAASKPAAPAAKIDSLYATSFSAPPPRDWPAASFDDSAWLLRRGREFVCGDGRAMEYEGADATSAYLRGTDPFLPGVGLLCQRCVFEVADPAKAGTFSLQLTYRGGFVAYLNGKEFARAGLPTGGIQPTTPSAAYELDAFFLRGGREPLNWYTHRTSDQWPLRERTFGPVDVPPALLRQGSNVLALEFHRSEYPVECKKSGLGFATLGLSLLELKAKPTDAQPLSTAPSQTKPSGVQAWTADVTKANSDLAVPGYGEKLSPVRIVGARNGSFSGQVMVASDKPLEGLSAAASSLTGEAGGTIPSEAVKIRYGAANPLWGGAGLDYRETVLPADAKFARGSGLGRRIDLLLDAPPVGAPAVAVWASVAVPKAAAAGKYRGKLTITVAGAAPAETPIELSVADWTLPDVKDYAGLINIYQSPDTLAQYYKQPRWSEQHWKLIDKSLALMGSMGNFGLFIPLLAESQMGNPESMVTWLQQADGTYQYDFAAFDRYIETAIKHHSRLGFVALNVWGYEVRNNAAAQVSVADAGEITRAAAAASRPATKLMKLPPYGTPECEALFRPLILALRDRLKAKGLEGKTLFGLASDAGPAPAHVAMFRNILPEAGWITESHMRIGSYAYDPADKTKTAPVRYNSIVWGGNIPDPLAKRLYGWQHPADVLVMNFNRAGTECLVLNGYPNPWSFRMWMESTLACGRNGNGRCGGDYWRIGAKLIGGTGSSEAVGGSGGTLFGMYLYSATGQTGLGNSVTDLFGPGPDGPVTTIRLENAREGNQEAEARVLIEKALLDKAAPLPAELARSCQQVLDERTNVLRMWSWGAAALAPYGWGERTRQLFDDAAAVHKARQGGNPN